MKPTNTPRDFESERLQLLMEATSEVFWDLDVSSGTLWCSNRQYKELFGYSDVALTREFWLDAIHPDDRQKVIASLETIRATRATRFTQEYRFRKADGSYAFVVNRGRVVYSEDGPPVRVVGVTTDVSEQKNAHLQAEQFGKRFEVLATVTNDGLYEWDIKKDSVWYNDQFFSLLGLPERPEVISETIWSDALAPEDKARILSEIDDALRNRRTWWTCEYRIVRPDGITAWISERATILYGDDGEPDRMIGGMVDITSRKESSEKLRESEERYRTVIDTASEGMILADAEYRMVLVNEAMATLMGMTQQELIGRPVEELIAPEDRELFLAESRRRRAGKNGRYDIQIQTGDGSQRWIRVSANAIVDDNGEFDGALAMCMDITERKRAEVALKEVTDRLSSILQNAPIGIAVVTPDGCVIEKNAAVQTMLGYSGEELTSLPFGTFTVQEDLDRELPLFQDVLDGRRDGYELEKRYIRKNGTTFWARLIVTPLKDANGKVSLVMGMVEDIDKRKSAEAALLYSKHQFERLMESGVVGMVHFDSEGRYFDANNAFLKMIGYNADELERDHLNFRDLVPAGQQSKIERAAQELAVKGFVMPFEKEFIRKDGTRIPVITSLINLNSHAGIAMVLDLSELKRAQEQVERLARIVESANDAVISLNLDGTVQTWNPGAERLYGFGAEEAVDSSVLKIVPADRVDEFHGLLAAVVSGEIVNRYETCRLSKSGIQIPVLLTVSPIRDRSGQVIGVSEIGLDLTETKNAELLQEKLRQAHKLEGLGRLAGGIAHDFNNLLMVITSYAEILQYHFEPDDRFRDHTKHILKAANRAAELTHQLLTFSRKQVISPEVMDLNSVVGETTKMLERLIGEDIHLSFVPGDSLAMVKADPGQMVQVLINLCVNSRDAMPLGGQLTIGTCNIEVDSHYAAVHPPIKVGSYVMLSVTDTGKGMSEEVKSRAFDPFFTTKPLGKGTGLGLATVYGIVKQNEGYIWLNSAPGQGTRLDIYLPCVSKANSVTLRDHSNDLQSGTETVLVVEDEPALRESVCEFLQSCGYLVLSAENGERALTTARQHKGQIHILLTDVVMPKVSGGELGKRLLQERPDISILYMSGYTDDSIVQHGVLAEGNAFLQKPFTLGALARKMRETIAGKLG